MHLYAYTIHCSLAAILIISTTAAACYTSGTPALTLARLHQRRIEAQHVLQDLSNSRAINYSDHSETSDNLKDIRTQLHGANHAPPCSKQSITVLQHSTSIWQHCAFWAFDRLV